ncbi:MAG: hypothetical protein QXO86_05930 [Nitrososphaerota archaeon]
MSGGLAEGVVERCERCGAVLDVSPDSVVVVCGYCGWVSLVGGGEAKVLAPDCADVSALRNLAESFVRSKAGGNVRLRELAFLMVPFWVVELDTWTRYNGYVEEVRTRQTGVGKRSRMESYRIYKPVRGEFKERVAVAVYGRRFEAIFGLSQLKASVISNYGRAHELNPQAIRGWSAISSELGESEAVEAAKTRVSEEHRARVESMTSKIFDCYTTANPLSSRLLIYPVVEARYEWGGKSYRICIDGLKDSPRILAAELPLTLRTRVARALLTVAGVAGAILLALVLQPLVGVEELPEELRLAAIAAAPIVSFVSGVVGAYSATIVQRVMRALKARDIMVLGG